MNKDFFDLAYKYSLKAFDLNEVPIGAVIVKNNNVISFGYNNKESNHSVFGHAEIMAIRNAEIKLNNWRLEDCDIYITLDPCPMCASAIKQSRIKNVYSALSNSDSNNTKIIKQIFMSDLTNPGVNFISNLDIERTRALLNCFFKERRYK